MLMENSSLAVCNPCVFIDDDIPPLIREELNADSDHDVLVRMRHLARKKRMRQPDITNEEMADYLALAENYRNYAHWLSAREAEIQKPASAAWIAATAVAVGLLTAMMIIAIAIAV
jgi:hypothetical protein